MRKRLWAIAHCTYPWYISALMLAFFNSRFNNSAEWMVFTKMIVCASGSCKYDLGSRKIRSATFTISCALASITAVSCSKLLSMSSMNTQSCLMVRRVLCRLISTSFAWSKWMSMNALHKQELSKSSQGRLWGGYSLRWFVIPLLW